MREHRSGRGTILIMSEAANDGGDGKNQAALGARGGARRTRRVRGRGVRPGSQAGGHPHFLRDTLRQINQINPSVHYGAAAPRPGTTEN